MHIRSVVRSVLILAEFNYTIILFNAVRSDSPDGAIIPLDRFQCLNFL
jgi:hypothetical protein